MNKNRNTLQETAVSQLEWQVGRSGRYVRWACLAVTYRSLSTVSALSISSVLSVG